jgi:hypothetical protein
MQDHLTRSDIWPLLRTLDELGPFFAIDRFDGSASWRPMGEFGTDPAGLVSVLAAVRQRLANRGTDRSDSNIRLRVAASVGFLGLAARLVSPALGVLARSGVLPDLGWADLWWRGGPGAQLSLAAGAVQGASVAGQDALIGPAGVAALQQMTIGPVLELGSVVADRYGLSPLIIRGNVASAVFGAGAVISSSAVTRADPRIGQRAARLVTDLLARPELSGAGAIDQASDGPVTFRRRSCCLLYQVPGAELCGDCVLRGHRSSRQAAVRRSGPAQQDDAGRNGE